MLKDFLLVRAAADVRPEDVQHYLEHVHAPLALATPALAREVLRYTMNHVRETDVDSVALYRPIPGLASIVEHMFGGWEGIARFSADEDYQVKVRPDEQHMVATLMDGAPQFVAIDEEVPIFDGGLPSKHRMLDFVRRPRTVSPQDFRRRLDDEADWARRDPSYRATISHRVHSIAGVGAAEFGAGAEPFDAVIEVWVAEADRLAEQTDALRARRASYCDPERCFTAVTEEHWISGNNDVFGRRGAETGLMSA